MPTTPADRTNATGEAQAGDLADQLEALEQRFVGLDGDELMMRLKDTVRAHLTRPIERDSVDDALTDGD